MEKFIILILALIFVFSSGLVGFIVFNYLERRDQKIRNRIEHLESEEEYLNRIHSDERKLNRSTYTVILMSLSISFSSLALLTATFAFAPSIESMKIVFLISAWMFLVAAGMCFYHFRSIMLIGDLNRTREMFRQRKSRLEDRLR